MANEELSDKLKRVDPRKSFFVVEGSQLVAVAETLMEARSLVGDRDLAIVAGPAMAEDLGRYAFVLGVVSIADGELTVHGLTDDPQKATAVAGAVNGEIRLVRPLGDEFDHTDIVILEKGLYPVL